MLKGILWADLTFSWFTDFHAFWAVRLSKIFRKKSIVIASGYSVANMPEIEYGLMQSSKSAYKVKFYHPYYFWKEIELGFINSDVALGDIYLFLILKYYFNSPK